MKPKIFTLLLTKEPVKVQKSLCNIYESKKLSKILYTEKKLLTFKMKEDKDLMAYLYIMNALANKLTFIDKLVQDANIMMTLFMSLSKSYNYLIVALESIKI